MLGFFSKAKPSAELKSRGNLDFLAIAWLARSLLSLVSFDFFLTIGTECHRSTIIKKIWCLPTRRLGDLSLLHTNF